MDPTPDRRSCPACGALLQAQDKFCWQCGAGMAQPFPASRPGRPVTVGEVAGRTLAVVGLVVAGAVLALLASAAACGASFRGGGGSDAAFLFAAAAVGCCVAAGRLLARRA